MGKTDERYPFIYTRFDCSSSEVKLRSCSSSLTSNIQYCSNNKVVEVICAGYQVIIIIIYK